VPPLLLLLLGLVLLPLPLPLCCSCCPYCGCHCCCRSAAPCAQATTVVAAVAAAAVTAARTAAAAAAATVHTPSLPLDSLQLACVVCVRGSCTWFAFGGLPCCCHCAYSLPPSRTSLPEHGRGLHARFMYVVRLCVWFACVVCVRWPAMLLPLCIHLPSLSLASQFAGVVCVHGSCTWFVFGGLHSC
jgi:hypothetical protein